MAASGPIQLFISYAAADEGLAIELEKHLALLQRSGVLRAWSTRKIGAGEDYRDAIDRELERADVIVFLVSADFLASDYLYDREMRVALRRHEEQRATIVPVLARPCDTQDLSWNKLDPAVAWLPSKVNVNGPVAISLWDDRDEALAAVAHSIRAMVRTSSSVPPTEGPVSRTFPRRKSVAWNVVPRKLPRFFGRRLELEQLGRDFEAGRSPVAVYGLGGMGKTELALQYARENDKHYDIVWCVRASERATLTADVAALAAELRLPGRTDSNQRVAIDALMRHLSQRDRWLLIFDGADDKSAIERFLVAEGGHVIITTRDPSFVSIATPAPLEPLDPTESLGLLFKLTLRDESESEDAAALAAALGHLPLALVQAGSYMVEAVMSFSTYLARFSEQQGELLRRGAGGADSVATAYGLAFNEVLGRSRAAAELLSLLAFFAPDNIPRDVLRVADTSMFPEDLADAVEQNSSVDDLIKVLGGYSLVEPHRSDEPHNPDSLRIHRLVQAVVRDRLSAEERATWAGHAVGIVVSSFPAKTKDHPENWPAAERWYPHAITALEHADRASAARADAERLMRRAAEYMFARKRNGDAYELYARALAIAEGSDDNARIAANLSGMAASLHQLRDFARAEELARRALKYEEPTIDIDGTESTTVRDLAAIALDESILALILLERSRKSDDRGMLNEALELARSALKRDEAAPKKDDAAIARDANCLGMILLRLGRLDQREHFDEAKALLERALKLDRDRLSPGNPELITRLNNLGFLLREMGDPKGAQTCFREALDIGASVYEADNPELATLHANLAEVLGKLKDFEQAKDHLEQALEIAIERYKLARGREIADAGYLVAIRRNNLGVLLSDMGDHEGAVIQIEQAIGIARKVLGAEHRRVKKLEENLRTVRKKSGSGS